MMLRGSTTQWNTILATIGIKALVLGAQVQGDKLITTTTTTTTTTTSTTEKSSKVIRNNLTYNEQTDAGITMDDETDLINNELVQIFFCIIYTIVFVLGVFGNVLVCYVVLRNRAMQTVTNIFITNLALSDILLCVLAVPFTPLYTFMGRWAFGTTLCHLVSFAQGCSIYISTLTLTSIAVDRYFVIIYPFHPRMKLSTCIAIIVSIWVVSVLATLPYGMYMKVVIDATSILPNSNVSDTISSTDHAQQYYTVESTVTPTITNNAAYAVRNTTHATVLHATELYKQLMLNASYQNRDFVHTFWESKNDVKTYCEENWPSEQYRKVFGSVTTILQFVLPFLIISICYTWVSVKLNARARAKVGTKSSQREEADRDRKKRTNRMLISMVAVFGLSWLPLNVVNIFDDFYEKSNEWPFYTLFFFVAHSIAMSSTCYNPFLYAWLNENFRKEFKHVLPCFHPSNNNVPQIARGFQRSANNNNGQRTAKIAANQAVGSTGSMLSAGVKDVRVGTNDATTIDDGNSSTLETHVRVIRENKLILPREPTHGNGSSSQTSPHLSVDSGHRQVNIVLNENNRLHAHGNLLAVKRDRRDNYMRDMESTDEQTTDFNFSETPFVSSDNNTGISMLDSFGGDDHGGGPLRPN